VLSLFAITGSSPFSTISVHPGLADLPHNPPLSPFPSWEVLPHPVGCLSHPMDLPSLPAPWCKPGRAAAVHSCHLSLHFLQLPLVLRCRRDRGRCRAQGVSNPRSTPQHRDVYLSLSSTARASLGRGLCTEEVLMTALGAPSRVVIAPSNPSLRMQSQRVKCWD